jgi:hypothetical protein
MQKLVTSGAFTASLMNVTVAAGADGLDTEIAALVARLGADRILPASAFLAAGTDRTASSAATFSRLACLTCGFR